ncbi:TetR/AcrR family transcriptional regulator [Burkholderia gladioli]|uniref:TetR/AcrR family transcriptional regulator n=1 Tax=Burkholderia gladioli TaxID=28095 RepID=UPI003EDF98B4
MREKIKQVATELLISRGFNGTSYGDIATRLGVTTTNIHYHFGNKQALVDEVVADYVAEAQGGTCASGSTRPPPCRRSCKRWSSTTSSATGSSTRPITALSPGA